MLVLALLALALQADHHGKAPSSNQPRTAPAPLYGDDTRYRKPKFLLNDSQTNASRQRQCLGILPDVELHSCCIGRSRAA
jgi:hypothetical protein